MSPLAGNVLLADDAILLRPKWQVGKTFFDPQAGIIVATRTMADITTSGDKDSIYEITGIKLKQAGTTRLTKIEDI